MNKILLLILCAACLVAITACSGREESVPECTPDYTSPVQTQTPTETPESPAEPVDIVEIHSAKMWNEFAESYNNKREKYADYVTVKITGELNFENIDFITLADGFSGKITAVDLELE